MLHDPSTEQIKAKLKAPRKPDVIEAHAGVASVNTDGGKPPTQPKCDGGNCEANADFNKVAQGPPLRSNFVAVPGR
jgi:hypothetical protein